MANEPSSSKTKLTEETFNAFNLEIQGSALTATRLAAGLPTDIAFHRSVDRDYADTVDACAEKALRIANRLLELISSGDPASKRAKGKRKFDDFDDVLDNFKSIAIDVLDQSLERAVSDFFVGSS